MESDVQIMTVQLHFLSELPSILSMGVKIKDTHFTEIVETVEAEYNVMVSEQRGHSISNCSSILVLLSCFSFFSFVHIL